MSTNFQFRNDPCRYFHPKFINTLSIISIRGGLTVIFFYKNYEKRFNTEIQTQKHKKSMENSRRRETNSIPINGDMRRRMGTSRLSFSWLVKFYEEDFFSPEIRIFIPILSPIFIREARKI